MKCRNITACSSPYVSENTRWNFATRNSAGASWPAPTHFNKKLPTARPLFTLPRSGVCAFRLTVNSCARVLWFSFCFGRWWNSGGILEPDPVRAVPIIVTWCHDLHCSKNTRKFVFRGYIMCLCIDCTCGRQSPLCTEQQVVSSESNVLMWDSQVRVRRRLKIKSGKILATLYFENETQSRFHLLCRENQTTQFIKHSLPAVACSTFPVCVTMYCIVCGLRWFRWISAF